MVPVWAVAGRQAKRNMGTRQVPMLAMGAAFCFTIMLFNIPALGGTTAHPVAGTLLAVLLGPWAAVIGISVALAIQALLFADGGLLAYGANCFTMAFVLPFVGYSVYRLIAGNAAPRSVRRALAAGAGSFLGLNAAAAVVGLLLGLQPALFHEPNGHALFFPFGLKVTLPAMLGTHLLIAGPAEAVVTALVVRYLQTAGQPLYGCADTPGGSGRMRREALWVGLLALVALSPLGLLASGDAFGEWDAKGVQEQIRKTGGSGYVPRGLEEAERHRYKGIPALRDYAQPEEGKSNLGYIMSALLGIGAISGLTLLVGRLLKQPNQPHPQPLSETPAPDSAGRSEASARAPNTLSKRGAFNSPLSVSERGLGVRSLPEWMSAPASMTAVETAAMRGRANPYLERTLAELTAGAATALRDARWARESGLLQRLDARARVVGLLTLMTVDAVLHGALPLITLYLLTLILGAASRLPLRDLVRRVWLSTPLFVGAIVLPQAFNLVTPGRAVIVLWHHPYLALTEPGLAAAGLLTLRVATAVSLGALLTLTSHWHDLLRALSALRAPRLFIVVLLMTYRYIALLLVTAGEMFVARRSRTVGRMSNAQGRRSVGAGIGALFGKSIALSEEVHSAMVSRGYRGDIQTLTRMRWRVADSVWMLTIVLISVLALGGDRWPLL
jgi:cobalt/nickel transport system permease protein